jgi:hypothetical protein
LRKIKMAVRYFSTRLVQHRFVGTEGAGLDHDKRTSPAQFYVPPGLACLPYLFVADRSCICKSEGKL